MSLPDNIEPGEMPGGLVIVTYVDDAAELVQKVGSDSDLIPASATYNSNRVREWVLAGRDVRVRIYNGNSGATVLTIDVVFD